MYVIFGREIVWKSLFEMLRKVVGVIGPYCLSGTEGVVGLRLVQEH